MIPCHTKAFLKLYCVHGLDQHSIQASEGMFHNFHSIYLASILKHWGLPYNQQHAVRVVGAIINSCQNGRHCGRRYFQMHFLEWKWQNSDSNFTEICPGVQLTISQHWCRQWLGAEQATSHCLSQCWPSSLMLICGTRGRWVKPISYILLLVQFFRRIKALLTCWISHS